MVLALALRRDRKHRLVQVGRDVADSREAARGYGARHRAGPRGSFEQAEGESAATRLAMSSA